MPSSSRSGPSASTHASPAEPSAWLVENRELLCAQPLGRALDVACGTGRNSAFLAGLGFAVDAVDRDDSALAAVPPAGEAGRGSIRTLRIDLPAAKLPTPPYDAIVNVNFLDRALFPALSDGLAPGGLLLFETFTRDHVDVLGHRMNPDYLLEPNELLRAFPALHVLHYREAVLGEPRPRAVASLVARLPRGSARVRAVGP